jgi:hypothetical protein
MSPCIFQSTNPKARDTPQIGRLQGHKIEAYIEAEQCCSESGDHPEAPSSGQEGGNHSQTSSCGPKGGHHPEPSSRRQEGGLHSQAEERSQDGQGCSQDG